jgi:hypothetical protein
LPPGSEDCKNHNDGDGSGGGTGNDDSVGDDGDVVMMVKVMMVMMMMVMMVKVMMVIVVMMIKGDTDDCGTDDGGFSDGDDGKVHVDSKNLAFKSYQRKFLTLQITCSSNEIALGCSLTKA